MQQDEHPQLLYSEVRQCLIPVYWALPCRSPWLSGLNHY